MEFEQRRCGPRGRAFNALHDAYDIALEEDAPNVFAEVNNTRRRLGPRKGNIHNRVGTDSKGNTIYLSPTGSPFYEGSCESRGRSVGRPYAPMHDDLSLDDPSVDTTLQDYERQYAFRDDCVVDETSFKEIKQEPKNLDYIFFSKDTVEPIQWLLPPELEAVKSYSERLPNRDFPSDHIPLVLDVRIKTRGTWAVPR